MNETEPRVGQTLIDNGRRCTIDGFGEDRGTRLSDGRWVCISGYVQGADGVWRNRRDMIRPDLERPVGESGPDDLARAAERLREGRGGLTGDPEVDVLLAQVFQAWARMGRQELDFLNRTGGPETVRLARRILLEGGGR